MLLLPPLLLLLLLRQLLLLLPLLFWCCPCSFNRPSHFALRLSLVLQRLMADSVVQQPRSDGGGAQVLLGTSKSIADEIVSAMPADMKTRFLAGNSLRPLFLAPCGTVDFQTIKNNAFVIKAFARAFPDTIPGIYQIACTLMHVNQVLGLYAPLSTEQCRIEQSLLDAGILKRGLQHARALARRSPDSRDLDVQEIKSLMVIKAKNASPTSDSLSPTGNPYLLGSLVSSSNGPSCQTDADDLSPLAHGVRPQRKKPRLNACPPEPAFIGEALSAVATGPSTLIATPHLQTDVEMKKLQHTKIMELPVPDATRVLPPNFDQKICGVYMRLPTRLLPQTPGKGKLNYTLKAVGGGGTIEVQLLNRLFRVIKCVGGKAWEGPASPAVSWAAHSNIDEAWDKVAEMAGGVILHS